MTSLCTLLQVRPMYIESTLLLSFVFSVSFVGQPLLVDVLLVNKRVYGNISMKEVVDFRSITEIKFPLFEGCLKSQDRGQITVKSCPLKRFIPLHIKDSEVSLPDPCILAKVSPPLYNNQRKWPDDLSSTLIKSLYNRATSTTSFSRPRFCCVG